MKLNFLTKAFCVLTVVLMVAPASLRAEDYNEFARKVRQEVWSWNLPGFDNRTIPEKYQKESAVILAAHSRVTATGKSKFSLGLLMIGAGATVKAINSEDVYRAMVLLNDKAALEKYSEFDYLLEVKRVRGFYTDKRRNVFGARIIKPDGTMREVNPEEAVNLTCGKNEKEDRQKLAISDLQVGDILDFFFYTESQLGEERMFPFLFQFSERYPMLTYSVHCEVSRKLTAEYRSINGAPQFLQSTDADGNIILDASATDLKKEPKSDLWYKSLRQFPRIFLTIQDNTSNQTFKPKSARASGGYADLPAKTIQKDAFYMIDHLCKQKYDIYFINQVAKMAKTYRKKHPGLTNDQLMDYLYESLAFRWPSGKEYGPRRFMVCLYGLMDSFDMPYKVGLSMKRSSERMDDIMQMYDAEILFMRWTDKKVYMFPVGYDSSGCLDDDFEGEPIVMIANKNMSYGAEQSFLYDTLPLTRPDDNTTKVRIHAALGVDQPLELQVDRDVEITGVLKFYFQSGLVNFEEWDKAMRRRLEIPQSLIEEYKKESKKYVNDLVAFLEKDRVELKDRYLAEINNYHGQEPKELMEYRLISPGVVADSAMLVYHVRYAMENMVKKAGSNLLVSVGQLIGSQMKLDEEERGRTEDAYMSAARSFRYDVVFTIPEGYYMNEENLAKLKLNVRNDCGFVTSDVVLKGQELVLTVQRQFDHAYEPASRWPQIVELCDAIADLQSQVVALKK